MRQPNQPTLGPAEIDLTVLEPIDTRSTSRSFLIELIGNMVVFIICTLVCLQVFAAAQSALERSKAVSELGLTSVNLAENWKAGYSLEELGQKYDGQVSDGKLTLRFDRRLQSVVDPDKARYQVTLSLEPTASYQTEHGVYTAATIQVTQGDDLLFEWQLGRNTSQSGGGSFWLSYKTAALKPANPAVVTDG
jgi:hypothetical protein